MGATLDSEMCLMRGIGVVLWFWKLKEKLHLEVSCSLKKLETETRETINKIKEEPHNTKYNWFYQVLFTTVMTNPISVTCLKFALKI